MTRWDQITKADTVERKMAELEQMDCIASFLKRFLEKYGHLIKEKTNE